MAAPLQPLHESGAVSDDYRKLTDVLALKGRFRFANGVVVFEGKAVRVIYRPDARKPDTTEVGIPYLVGEGFGIEREPEPENRFRVDGFWVRNDTAGQTATAIAQGLVEHLS